MTTTEKRKEGRRLGAALGSALRPKERFHTSIRMVQEVMLWVGEDHAPSSVIAEWSQAERDAVIEYLATVHFVASDNPGKVPPRPKCLDAWRCTHDETRADGDAVVCRTCGKLIAP